MKQLKWFTLLFLITDMACRSSGPMAGQNLAFRYSHQQESWIAGSTLFRSAVGDKLFIKVWKENLLYTREKLTDTFTNYLMVKYLMFDNIQSRNPADSGSKLIRSTMHGEWLVDSIELRWAEGKSGYADIRLTDLNRKQSHRIIQYYTPAMGQHLLLDSDGFPMVHRTLQSNKEYQIRSANNSSLAIFVIETDTLVALPPFAEDKAPPILSLKGQLLVEDNRIKFHDSLNNTPFLIKVASEFGNDMFFVASAPFPLVESTDALTDPLIYITTKEEFEALSRSRNSRVAVDRFWLEIGGSKERARQLIKLYYERVEEANRLFSNTKAGWMTDRGMVYMVYGPPEKVYLTQQGEIWIYNEQARLYSTQFTFVRKGNLIADDLYLERNKNLQSIWFNAVERWRNGFPEFKP